MRLTPSIDEMARDARDLSGTNPSAWACTFRQFLACYGWKILRVGRVYFIGPHTVLEDWEIVR